MRTIKLDGDKFDEVEVSSYGNEITVKEVEIDEDDLHDMILDQGSDSELWSLYHRLVDKLEVVGIEDLTEQVQVWHHHQDLIHGSTDQAQALKLVEEVGELVGNIARGKKGTDLMDDLGDIEVVLTNIRERNKLTAHQCLAYAYNEIKGRKGHKVGGVLVKEGDL